MTGYHQWLLLWKWFDLLARSETAEVEALLAPRLFEEPSSGKLTFLPLGVEMSRSEEDALQPLSPEKLAEIFSHPETRKELSQRILAPEAPEPQEQAIAERLSPQTLSAWVTDPAFSEMFFATLSTEDYAPGVLGILQDIQEADPAAFRAYPGLALAIAVVRDFQMPAFWPHHQVKQKDVPLAGTTPVEWFQRWVKANKSKSLLADLRSMKPEALKFVVDAPLSESEFAWATKNARFPRSGFAKAFSAVPYVMERLKNQEYVWNQGEYTLERILKDGGICVDQAYFAMIAGKARGIPTLFFTGQGSDGGHAWFGFLKTGDRWELNAGRYENQNYATGEALDPQTWRPISDHELKALAEGFRDKPPFMAARDDLLLAALFEKRGNLVLAEKASASAVAVCPEMPEAWDARGSFLARSGAAPETRRIFHEAAVRQFANRPDLRTRHQGELVALAQARGDTATAAQLERQIISANRRKRVDLSVNAAAKKLVALLEEGKPDEAFSEYRRLLNSLKATGGGSFFYEIVAPFSSELAARKDTKRARDAVALARKALKPETESILSQEFDALESELRGGGD